jgi:Uma2 family endonuclease
LDLQNKILHCLSQGTQLAWLIDMRSQQVWAWQGDELPTIYFGLNKLPTLSLLPDLTVNEVMAMID